MSHNNSDFTRYIGIIGDGTTDRLIVAKFATALLEPICPCKIEELKGFSLRDSLDAFWRESDKTNDYNVYGKTAATLRNTIISILVAALPIFQNQMQREIRDCDLLVLNTDAEKPLTNQDSYFEQRIFVTSKVFSLAIEEFYHKICNQGYQREYLPLVLPLVLFPSTEILVAAFGHSETEAFQAHGKKAKLLKQELFGTDDMRSLTDEEFDEKALNFITRINCEKVYKLIPESRNFIRSLFWNQVGQVQG